MLFNVDWVGLWKDLNKLLADNPILEKLVFGGLPFLLLFFRKVREWLVAKIRWFRDQVLCAYVFPFLGLATTKDLEQFATKAEVERALATHRQPQAAESGILKQRTIQRGGVKIALAEGIWRYLGKTDEAAVSAETIDSLLHGPYCPVCSRNLVFRHQASRSDPPKMEMRTKCDDKGCSWVWKYNPDPTWSSIPVKTIKRSLYDLISAEFRRTGTLQDTDEPAQAKTP